MYICFVTDLHHLLIFFLNIFFLLATLDNGKAGPMAEYKRRIASGELLAGDTFQVQI